MTPLVATLAKRELRNIKDKGNYSDDVTFSVSLRAKRSPKGQCNLLRLRNEIASLRSQ